jgi:hypothetical protein
MFCSDEGACVRFGPVRPGYVGKARFHRETLQFLSGAFSCDGITPSAISSVPLRQQRAMRLTRRDPSFSSLPEPDHSGAG